MKFRKTNYIVLNNITLTKYNVSVQEIRTCNKRKKSLRMYMYAILVCRPHRSKFIVQILIMRDNFPLQMAEGPSVTMIYQHSA